MLALAPIAAQAEDGTQATARTQAQHPDFSGFWSPLRQQHPMNQDMIDRLPPGTVVLDDASFVEFPQGEYGGLIPTPEALARAEEWTPADAMLLTNVCQAPSVIYSMQGPFPFEIYQTDALIVIKLEYFNQVRVVFMDGRPHPGPDAPHTMVGHSIGHWDGDDLVVDTTHLKPATLTNNGLEHSENVHFVERFRVSDDGKLLEFTQWFSDPDNLENDGARYMRFEKVPDSYVLDYSCDPTFAIDYDNIEEGSIGAGEAEVTIVPPRN